MKWLGLLVVLGLAPNVLAARPAKRDYDAHDFYVVHLSPHADLDSVASRLDLHYDGPLGEIENHHIFRSRARKPGYDHVRIIKNQLRDRRQKRAQGAQAWDPLDHVVWSQKQELHKRFPLVKRSVPAQVTRDYDHASGLWERQNIDAGGAGAVEKGLAVAKSLGIMDPIFHEQWHLYNPIQIGHDINVTGVWAQGITGKNTTTCIVDDGLDLDSDDLKDNYWAEGSYDFNDQVNDPKPRLSDDKHGTRCAGEVAAVRNDVCGVGVAYDGRIAGLRILSKVITDADEAVAMNYAYNETQIYSCSWGPPDDGQAMDAPGILIRKAMVNGVQKGRNGLGSIYVFAIGNGAANDDNCNFDGYTNSIYSVSVGGIDRKGLHPYYSEKCSAQLVVTYSSGSGDAIHTTDVGQDKCYTNHGGTSAAGPLVAGIYALMLEVNPLLTWRDIQWLTILNAVRVDNDDAEYQHNDAIDRDFSHQYGYGKADAWAMVEAAKLWTSVKPQAWYFSPWQHVKHEIPQGDQGLASHFGVTREMLDNANLERLEHVTVTMNVEHTRRGDLSVDLKSPSGMISHLATHRRNDNAASGYVDWTFMSVAHWGEDGVGTWTVIVKDTNVNDHEGTFTDWRLRLWGEAIKAEGQQLISLPTEHDDDDHDREDATVSTTSVAVPTETGLPPGNPDDHPNRPTKPKPTEAETQAGETLVPQPEEETPSQPEPTPTPSTSNFLPRPFPTFGVSKRTQIWIYGAVGLILLFLLSLGAYWMYVRRKRRWMNRENYEFEMVDGNDPDDGQGGASQQVNGESSYTRGRRKGGELYDAFAEESEEEHPFDLASEYEGDTDSEEIESRSRADQRYRDSDAQDSRPA